jgi:TPR repeat protein
MNPDALPEHPAPVRPGLMQNQGMTQSPVPQPYPQPGPPPRAPTMPQQAMNAPQAGPIPVTMDELARLRSIVNNNPNDQTTQMTLAEKLVEASTLLPNSDQKSRDKARRKLLDEASRLLKRLIGYGSADAMFFMADCHGKGLFTPGPDFKEAFNMYQQAAKQNHAQAAYRLAVCCELGQDEGGGTRRDPIKAIQWYRRAATLGDTPAMYKIGVILLKGLLGQSRNPREAMQWLQKAAERADVDNPHAVHELARYPPPHHIPTH